MLPDPPPPPFDSLFHRRIWDCAETRHRFVPRRHSRRSSGHSDLCILRPQDAETIASPMYRCTGSPQRARRSPARQPTQRTNVSLSGSSQNVNESAEVRLAFSRGIFHPKLYLFETTRAGWVAWVGSANATEAALGEQSQNEEILLRLEPAPPSLLAYSASVWRDGKRLKDCRPPVNSLPAFFRTGDLYYKPYVHESDDVQSF